MSLNIYLNKEVALTFKDGSMISRVLVAYDEHYNVLVRNEEKSLTFFRGESILYVGLKEN